MSRTFLSLRSESTIDMNIGKILIFCEGSTEENYFNYFKERISRIRNKYNTIVIKTENVGSNARAVLNYASSFLSDENNFRMYNEFEKYLVFDCDAPPNILSVIDEAKQSEFRFNLLKSNPVFEIWLLMHLEEVDASPIRKSEVGRRLETHLGIIPGTYEKEKNSKGLVAAIIGGYKNIENAIHNAQKIKEQCETNDYDLSYIISNCLSYTEVDDLVGQLAKAASY